MLAETGLQQLLLGATAGQHEVQSLVATAGLEERVGKQVDPLLLAQPSRVQHADFAGQQSFVAVRRAEATQVDAAVPAPDPVGRDPRLHLVLAGGGPEEDLLRARLGEHATFLGWLTGTDLARAYASADVFLFASSTETFGQVVLESQASGLPVVAVDRGGPASLIEHGETGLLAPPEISALADAVLAVTTTPLLSERIGRGALAAVRGRSWEAALDRLAAAYRIALSARTDQRLARGVA